MASDKLYVTAVGFIQFDPQEREVNGKAVTDVVIKTPGGDGKNIRITIWPEFVLPEKLEKGDFIAVDGTFDSSTYQGKDGDTKTSLQISPYKLAILGKPVARTERDVVSSGSSSAGTSSQTTKVPF